MQVFAPVTSFKVFLAKVTPMEGGFLSYNENKLAQTLGVIGERKKKTSNFLRRPCIHRFPWGKYINYPVISPSLFCWFAPQHGASLILFH